MSRKTAVQTDVRLPRTRNGLRIKHPFAELFAKMEPGAIAKVMGVDRSTVYHHLKKVNANRDCLLMAEVVLSLAKASGIEPHFWRPDLYPKEGIAAVK